jgi:hypothetical protein
VKLKTGSSGIKPQLSAVDPERFYRPSGESIEAMANPKLEYLMIETIAFAPFKGESCGLSLYGRSVHYV